MAMEVVRIAAALDALDRVPLSKLTVRDLRYIIEATTYHNLWHEELVALADGLETLCRQTGAYELLQIANAVNPQTVSDNREEREHKNKY